jgi:mRNA interferase RelE/StbE
LPDYRLVVARSAERDLAGLPNALQERIISAIDRLASEPRPPGVKKLKGPGSLWRIRVGDYRVIYTIRDKERVVDVSHIRDRKEAYD